MSTTIEEKMKEIAERAASVDDAKGLAVFDGKITPAGAYKDAFAQYSQVTPSNEIDYGNTMKVENPDLVDKIDPSIVKSPMEVVKDAKEAQAFSDYVNSLYSQSDYEADEKRKKAAQWVTAAQILGDSLAALGNVYWTGKGAAPQQLSHGTGKAAAATYQLEQDIRNARERAAKAKMDATLKKYEMEMQRKKDEQAQENWQKTFDANEKWREQQQKNWVTGNAQSQAQQAIANALSERGMKVQEQQAKTAAAREYRLGKDENKPEMFLLDEGWVSVPKEKWTDTEVAAVYAKIPKEIRESIEKVVTEKGEGYTKESTSKSIKPTPQQMRQWIGEYKHLPEVANAIRRLAGLKPVEKDEREKEDSSAINTELPIQAYSAPADEWGSQWRRRAGLDTTDFSQFKRK